MATRSKQLNPKMTLAEFDNGYWYATEIKAFAKDIGIVGASALRKDELEALIRTYLEEGRVVQSRRDVTRDKRQKDSERGLTLGLPVSRYTNNHETKAFIVRHAQALDENFKEKPGARYRLNRWREAQMASGAKITYGDLVRHFVELCRTDGRFPQIPSGRYINFLSDYLAGEKDATRADALAAWHSLKTLDVPKDYRSWKKHIGARR